MRGLFFREMGVKAMAIMHREPIMYCRQAEGKMFSPVGVETYMKLSEIQLVTEEGLRSLAPIIETLSQVEGLDGHWNSINQRLNK